MGLAPIWRLRGKEISKPQQVSKAKAWIELKQAVPACTACGLHKTRKQTVLGVGDEQADWLLVGEAPGAEEDRLGEPFVGQAGRRAAKMPASVSADRRQHAHSHYMRQSQPPRNPHPA